MARLTGEEIVREQDKPEAEEAITGVAVTAVKLQEKRKLKEKGGHHDEVPSLLSSRSKEEREELLDVIYGIQCLVDGVVAAALLL